MISIGQDKIVVYLEKISNNIENINEKTNLRVVSDKKQDLHIFNYSFNSSTV